MNGCVVNLNKKGTKTYLKVQFNSPVYSGEMAIHGQIIMVLMDSGFNRETLANNLLLHQVSLYRASPSQWQKQNEDRNDDYHFFL